MKNKNTTSWGPEIWKPTPVSIKYQEPNLAYLKDYITTDIEESWIVNAKNKESDDLEFQGWFNGAKSLEEIVSNGFIDFSHKIFTQDLYQYLGNPREKTSLEIGFGAVVEFRMTPEIERNFFLLPKFKEYADPKEATEEESDEMIAAGRKFCNDADGPSGNIGTIANHYHEITADHCECQ